jgi:hypothetical protein
VPLIWTRHRLELKGKLSDRLCYSEQPFLCSESYVNPEAFRYLENKRPLKEIEDNLTIDDRPIVDQDAFRYLEARQANKVKKRDDTRSSIDETPIVNPEAFRYLEKRAEVAKNKKNSDVGPAIDETPQVDLKAFQYLERKNIPKRPEEGPTIDESSIVNPEAFKYLGMINCSAPMLRLVEPSVSFPRTKANEETARCGPVDR